MKIVSIFDEQLYAFHHSGEADNEFDRLMELWTDVEYLKNYAETNNITNIKEFVESRLEEVDEIQDLLEELTTQKQPLDYYFEPLSPSEYQERILSLKKGKIKHNQLRIYAVKIDKDCFIITGGAIKMSQTMQGHPDTTSELAKLNRAKDYLTSQGIIDLDSFYELIDELHD
ncbi:MAG: hypothetical protein ABF257_09475 [Polaribacter sp.]